jgi:hypothetical protein
MRNGFCSTAEHRRQSAAPPAGCSAQETDLAIIAESARWGVTNAINGSVITHADWLQEQNFLLTNWFPQRTDIFIEQLRTAGLYPEVAAPLFTPHGGIIAESLPVTITIPIGTALYYSTNGADPRLPGGGISADAVLYDQGSSLTLTLTNSVQLRARSLVTNAWSALVEADYHLASEVTLRISNLTCRDDGSVKLDFVAWPGLSYSLWACSELHSAPTFSPSWGVGDWETIAMVVPLADGTVSFVDAAATNYAARFYRLTWP